LPTKLPVELQRTIDEANKKYGEKAVIRASDIEVPPPIPSASLHLDFAIGIGGLPQNRVVECFGQEGCGKTTLGLLTMANFLKANPKRAAVILDMEHKTTKSWLYDLLGAELMDSGRVLYARPLYAEQATNMYVDLVGSGQVCFVLYDSIGGAPPKAVMDKDAEKAQVGGNSPAITKFARLAGTYSDVYNCLTFCINQTRDDMEGFRRHNTPGGRGVKHAYILRIYMRKSTKDKREGVVNGEKMIVRNKIHATIVKNQLAAEGRTAEWWFQFVATDTHEFGIDTLDEIIRLSTSVGVVNQRSSMYDHPALPGGTVKSRDGLEAAIRADDSLRATIVSEVMAALKGDDTLVGKLSPIDPEWESDTSTDDVVDALREEFENGDD
jgi:recombination protein RecA